MSSSALIFPCHLVQRIHWSPIQPPGIRNIDLWHYILMSTTIWPQHTLQWFQRIYSTIIFLPCWEFFFINLTNLHIFSIEKNAKYIWFTGTVRTGLETGTWAATAQTAVCLPPARPTAEMWPCGPVKTRRCSSVEMRIRIRSLNRRCPKLRLLTPACNAVTLYDDDGRCYRCTVAPKMTWVALKNVTFRLLHWITKCQVRFKHLTQTFLMQWY